MRERPPTQSERLSQIGRISEVPCRTAVSQSWPRIEAPGAVCRATAANVNYATEKGRWQPLIHEIVYLFWGPPS
jgi:hypothetical protein